MNAPVGVGVIGAGMISDYYLENLVSFPDVAVHAVGDLDTERAKTVAEKYGVAASGDAAMVLDHPDIEIVVNLTIPAAHESVSVAAIEAGKHVWTEKPLAVDRAAGQRILAVAEAAHVRVGCAPDTVLGPGFQTAKRAIESGLIGTPLSALTSLQWQGPDWAHPNPDFLFARGGGPLFDMGPYYVSALVHLFGSIDRVAAMGSKAAETRTVRTGPRTGEVFPVEVPTQVAVLSEFATGQTAQSTFSVDSPLFRHGFFEVTGTEGTLVMPDPNMFTGDIRLYRRVEDFSAPIEQESVRVPVEGVPTNRGLGVVDLARAIREGRPHLATGDLGYHVLDVLVTIEEAAAEREYRDVESKVERPTAMPAEFDPFAATV